MLPAFSWSKWPSVRGTPRRRHPAHAVNCTRYFVFDQVIECKLNCALEASILFCLEHDAADAAATRQLEHLIETMRRLLSTDDDRTEVLKTKDFIKSTL